MFAIHQLKKDSPCRMRILRVFQCTHPISTINCFVSCKCNVHENSFATIIEICLTSNANLYMFNCIHRTTNIFWLQRKVKFLKLMIIILDRSIVLDYCGAADFSTIIYYILSIYPLKADLLSTINSPTSLWIKFTVILSYLDEPKLLMIYYAVQWQRT